MRGLASAFVAGLRRPKLAVPERFADFLRWVGKSPSPVVEAICDASEGRSITSIDDDLAVDVFGCRLAELPTSRRRVVAVRAGGRGGKTSHLGAPKAVHAAFTVDLPTLAKGEHAVSLIVAPRQAESLQALSFCRGILESVPELRACVENIQTVGGVERVGSAECITIRRPHDGQLVDLRIGVASNGGISARARTLVNVVLDEAAFFRAEGEATDRALHQAAIQRIVPGGQEWMLSTPWIQGFGVMEELIELDWARHRHTLVARGGTRQLNPKWDPDGTIESHMRETDPDNAAREIDAIPLPAGSKIFFPPEVLQQAVNDNRPRTLEPRHDLEHLAAGDLGFRRNSSALAIAREEAGKARIAYLEEIRPKRDEPLRPGEVCRGFAEACGRYGAWSYMGDLHYADSAREHFDETRIVDPRDAGMLNPRMRTVEYVDFNPSTEATSNAFARVREMMADGRAEVPNDPRLLAQLRRVTAKPAPGGAIRIELPRVGREHGDLAFAAVLVLSRFGGGDGLGVWRAAMERLSGESGAPRTDNHAAELRRMLGR